MYFSQLNNIKIFSKSSDQRFLTFKVYEQAFPSLICALWHIVTIWARVWTVKERTRGLVGLAPGFATMSDTQIPVPPTFNRRPKMSTHVGFSCIWDCRFWWACLRGNVVFGSPTNGVNLNVSDLRWTYPRFKFQFYEPGTYFRGSTLGVNLICVSSSSPIQMSDRAVFS